MLMDAGTGISGALTDMGSVITSLIGIITGNAILFAMFGGALLIVGAKVFKKIKNSSKS